MNRSNTSPLTKSISISNGIRILLLSFLVIGCGINKEEALNHQETPQVEACKVPKVLPSDLALGFPMGGELAPSIGTVNMTVLFVDFEDVPATQSLDSVFSIISPIAPEFFKEISYGRMELNLLPHFEWLRLSKSSEYYGTAIYRGQSHLDFIQEAVDLADDQVDFSQTHIVLVMTNPEAKALRQGPTFKSTNTNYQIRADGASIPTGITSGYDLNYWGGLWLAHETGHSLGLPDLYHYGTSDFNRYVGTFGLMGTIDAKSPGFFAFERWMLGWLDDSQIYCHQEGNIIVEVESISNIGGAKALMVPLDSTTVLVVESRRKTGHDKNMSKEGALVYIVNTSLNNGRGPIRVKPGVDNGDLMEEAPMQKGDTYTYRNVTVEVLESNGGGDKVKVVVE